MDRAEVYERLTEVFRDVFDDPTIEISDSTTSKDIEGWDSLEHINLIAAVNDEFEIKIPMAKINGLQNVGDMVNVILENV